MKIAIGASLFTKGDMQINSCQFRYFSTFENLNSRYRWLLPLMTLRQAQGDICPLYFTDGKTKTPVCSNFVFNTLVCAGANLPGALCGSGC